MEDNSVCKLCGHHGYLSNDGVCQMLVAFLHRCLCKCVFQSTPVKVDQEAESESVNEGQELSTVPAESPRPALVAFEKWWASKVAEGYQYGRGPLATVRFGFEAGFAAARTWKSFSKIRPPIQSEVVGCAVDRPLRLRSITDDDLTRASNESYQHGRRHGKEELADEIETLIYWLLRCYQSGHREGWEKGPTTQETMDSLLHVLANRGYDPNEDAAVKELIIRMEKR